MWFEKVGKAVSVSDQAALQTHSYDYLCSAFLYSLFRFRLPSTPSRSPRTASTWSRQARTATSLCGTFQTDNCWTKSKATPTSSIVWRSAQTVRCSLRRASMPRLKSGTVRHYSRRILILFLNRRMKWLVAIRRTLRPCSIWNSVQGICCWLLVYKKVSGFD